MPFGASLPVTVDVQQQVGGADGESDLVPEAVSQAVGEGLRARLAFEAIVIADLLSHSAALQFKVTAAENRSGRQRHWALSRHNSDTASWTHPHLTQAPKLQDIGVVS